MANRYAINDQRAGGDWFDQQQDITVNPNAAGAEMGGIAGTGNTVQGGASPYNVSGTWNAMPAGQPKMGATPGAAGGSFAGMSPQQAWEAARTALGYGATTPQDQATLQRIADYIRQGGGPAITATGADTIQLPGGQIVDVLTAGNQWWWGPEGAGMSGAGGSGMGQPQVGGIGGIPPPFQMPSLADLQATPGYQARLATGQQALERSAAAKGSLLSGGTQKALDRYAQDYASNEYGNAFNRALGQYMTNFQTQSQEPWNRYNQIYQGGLNAILGTRTNVPLG